MCDPRCHTSPMTRACSMRTSDPLNLNRVTLVGDFLGICRGTRDKQGRIQSRYMFVTSVVSAKAAPVSASGPGPL